MDEFPFSYVNFPSKEKKSKPRIKEKKDKIIKQNSLRQLIHSNSDSDFIIKTEKEKRKIIRHYLNKKNKLGSLKNSKDSRIKSSPFKKGLNLKKIIHNNKNKLSNYIENNTKKVELFGNPRYKHNSPILFVEDFKNNLPEKKMGLVPLPSKKKTSTDLYKEPKNLYDMQRNISMIRRFQYEKKNEKRLLEKKNYKNVKDTEHFNMIQNWWKKIPKIIDIQRIFRGYIIRKQVNPILKLYKFMKKFEKFLKNLILKTNLKIIKDYSILRRKKIINGNYISKKRLYISNKLNKSIIMIENNYRCYKSNAKKIFLQRGKNGRVINKMSFISKIIYNENSKINKDILLLEDNIKNYIKSKNYVDKNLIHKNKGFYYYDKIYLNKDNKKIIDFMKLITHGLQLMAFKKKIFYKNPSEYDIDDINKIKYIQKKYLEYYYNNKENICLYNIRNNIGLVDKIRKKKINKDIEIIQKQIKQFLNDKNNYKKQIIKNKPISGNQINANHNLEQNINNASFISKEYIKNVNNLIIPIQKIMHKFLRKRNDKYRERKTKINKVGFHNYFFFTKECSNKEKFIKLITNFQKLYKDQYKNNKNDIIANEKEISLSEYNSLEDITIPKKKTLRQLKLKNKIPKTISFGLYISKQRFLNTISKYTVKYNKNNILTFRQEGLIITKVRKRNYENELKKIQNNFRKYKKKNYDFLGIQKPQTDEKNFYTYSSESYDDIIYSKKLNNYYFLTKETKINIIDKIKKIQTNFLKHSNNIKLQNDILKKGKIILNQKTKKGLGLYIDRIRYVSLISNVKNDRNINYIIPLKKNIYISKVSYYDNKKEILFLQQNLRNKIIKKENEKNDIFSRKNLIDNFERNKKNSKNKDKFNSQIVNQTFSLGLYISKNYQRKIYKKEIIKLSLITKFHKIPENVAQVNIKFLLLTSLFITKNIQEYIFNLFKNKIEIFEYPFYLTTINRVLKYLQSNESKGKNVQLLFNQIFSDYNSNNTVKKDLILLLTKDKEDILRNTNIYNKIELDFSEYVCGFSKFDKNLSNEKFLNVRLNNTTFHNTNIFTITKLIDKEFENFVNGKYCYKCYLDPNLCKCFKTNEELTDEALDIGIQDDYNPKNSIKFFEYDNNKTRGIGTLIEGKPKIDNKDEIITQNKFINEQKKSELIDENKRKKGIFIPKKKYEYLRYYNNKNDKEQNKDEEKIKLRNNN